MLYLCKSPTFNQHFLCRPGVSLRHSHQFGCQHRAQFLPFAFCVNCSHLHATGLYKTLCLANFLMLMAWPSNIFLCMQQWRQSCFDCFPKVMRFCACPLYNLLCQASHDLPVPTHLFTCHLNFLLKNWSHYCSIGKGFMAQRVSPWQQDKAMLICADWVTTR